MNTISLKQFRQNTSDYVSLLWSDGHEGTTNIHSLRDQCPCAGCSGETVLFRSYVPPEPEKGTPGRYELRNVEVIGGYGLKIVWGDGHDTGIYTWEHLRSLCECIECAPQQKFDKTANK